MITDQAASHATKTVVRQLLKKWNRDAYGDYCEYASSSGGCSGSEDSEEKGGYQQPKRVTLQFIQEEH